MAIRLTDEFPSKTKPPTTAYPDGSYLDESAPGANDGTPLTERLHDDYEGYKQSILSQAGVTANGQPDSVTNPQILQALLSIIAQERQTSSLSNLYPLSIGTETSLQGASYGGPGSGIIVVGYPTSEQETIYTVIDGPASGTINSISASNQRVNIDGILYTIANYVDTIGGNVGDYLGPYAAGLVFNNRTDWTIYQGQSYKLRPSIPLGFTTTGDFNVDVNSLQPFDNSERAEFQADRAEQEANNAEASAQSASDDADRAEQAVLDAAVTSGGYLTVADGVAATTSGDLFLVVSQFNEGFYDLYLNDTNVGVYQNKTSIDINALDRFEDVAAYNEAGSQALTVISDERGFAVFVVLNDGSIDLVGIDESLQEYITTLRSDLDSSIEQPDRDVVTHSLTSSNGIDLLTILDKGDVFLTGIASSIQSEIGFARGSAQLSFADINDTQKQLLAQDIDQSSRITGENNQFTITPFGDGGFTTSRIPTFIEKNTPNEFIVFHQQGIPGFNGDGEGVRLVKRDVSVSDSGEVTVGPLTLIQAPSPDVLVVNQPMALKTNTGRILLTYASNKDTTQAVADYNLYLIYSDDDGVTWSTEQTIDTKTGLMTLLSNGATGNIIQTPTGRIIIPEYGVNDGTAFVASLYSDDNGDSWNRSAFANRSDLGSLQEPAAAVLQNGDIYFYCRTTGNSGKKRVLKSTDDGLTFTDLGDSVDLTEPRCASSAFYAEYGSNGKVLFSGPSNDDIQPAPQQTPRTRFRLRASYDGENYKASSSWYPDSDYIGYSCIKEISGGRIMIVYEGSAVVSINSKESISGVIVNTKEVFSNVHYN